MARNSCGAVRDSDDEGHGITCPGCRLEHHGAFGSDAAEDWNADRLRLVCCPGEVTVFERDATPSAGVARAEVAPTIAV